MRLAVACTDALGWQVVRRRWNDSLPAEFDEVAFFNPEDFGNPYLKKGFRTLAKSLAMRRAVSAAIRWGADRVLVATNGEATILTPHQAPKLAIYGDASGRQLNELYRFNRSERKMRARDERLRSLGQRGTIFLSMSTWCAEGFQRDYLLPTPAGVLPPPMDTHLFTPPKSSPSLPRRALFIGGDFLRKGGRLLLEATTKSELASVQWDIVTGSDVPSAPNLKIYHGVRPQSTELLALLASAHVFAFPTEADCSPLAVLEAMSFGIPVVAKNVGGLSDMVDDMVGKLLPPSADAVQFATAIAEVLSDESRRQALGNAARQRVVANNSLAVHAKRLRSFLSPRG